MCALFRTLHYCILDRVWILQVGMAQICYNIMYYIAKMLITIVYMLTLTMSMPEYHRFYQYNIIINYIDVYNCLL